MVCVIMAYMIEPKLMTATPANFKFNIHNLSSFQKSQLLLKALSKLEAAPNVYYKSLFLPEIRLYCYMSSSA